MSRSILFVAALAVVAAIHNPVAAQCAPARSAPPGVWDTTNATLSRSTRPAPDRIALVRGIACRPDLTLDDGIIEFELAPSSEGFAGIAFRMASSADYEMLYFRVGNDGHWAEAQYQPVYQGETTWQLYPGDGYQADLPNHVSTTHDGWMRVRLIIAGSRADLLVTDDTVPALRIRELKRPRQAGPIGIWGVGYNGTNSARASIRNLRVRPLGNVTLADVPPESASPGQLMNWRVSPRFAAPDSITFADTLSSAVRGAARDGQSVAAERSGLVNLTAFVGNPAGAQQTNVVGGIGWGVAYAMMTIHANQAETRRLSLSYSEAVCVYVDGRAVYVGDNRYAIRNKGNLGIVGHEGETAVLRLHPGDNEIVLAVADKAFGWGFKARID